MKPILFDTIQELAIYSAEAMTGPNIAISGGSTFGNLFKFWSEIPKLREFNFFPVDERVVSFEDEHCNWNVATENLFKPLNIEDQKKHWAESYESYLKILENKVGQPPVFNQIFLGMGADGHTASLFPGGEELLDQGSTLLQSHSPKAPEQRISLGLKILWACEELILIVTGKEKSGLVKRIIQNEIDLPVSLALKGHANPVILLDKEASSELYLSK